jgi:acid phosphatase
VSPRFQNVSNEKLSGVILTWNRLVFRLVRLPPHRTILTTITDWPYCGSANRLRSIILSGISDDSKPQWDHLEWRRRLEKFGKNDVPEIAAGPGNVYDGIWYEHPRLIIILTLLSQPGELSDLGRKTTFELGQRLRHLYIDQLNFVS